MNDELTKADLQKMQEEIDYRTGTLRPELLEAVKHARGFGDLSENFEYKEAKRAKNRNEGRIRYLRSMIKTATVISGEHAEGRVGLFDWLTLYLPEDDEEMRVQLVTTLRVDADEGRISRDSPLGKAVFDRTEGETVQVEVNEDVSYPVEIRRIEKGQEDNDLPIAGY